MIEQRLNNEFIIIDMPNTITENITFKHKKCHHIFKALFGNIIKRDIKCPSCKKEHIRLTTENEISKTIKNITNNEYELIPGSYINSQKKIKIKHNTCGEILTTTAHHFIKSGTRCKHCRGYTVWDNKKFQDMLDNFHGNDYKLIGNYNPNKVTIKHITCGRTYTVDPYAVTKGSKCLHCSLKRTKPYTLEEFQKYINKTHPNIFTIIQYDEKTGKTTIKHNACNETFNTNYKTFTKSKECPICNPHLKTSVDTDLFKKQIKHLTDNTFTILSEYKTSNTPIKIRHDICNHIFETKPHLLKRYKSCPKCRGAYKYNEKSFIERLYDTVGDEYKLKSDYKKESAKVTLEHTICGNLYHITPTSFFIGGYRCPSCKMSSGEQKIHKILSENNIKFYSQYKIKDSQHILYVDFYLPDYNLFIEYDGIQHTKPVKFFGGIEEFKKIKNRDTRKNNYASNHNIQMLRIPYTEHHNIENIIRKSIPIK